MARERDDANDYQYYRDDDPPGLAYASSGSPVSIGINIGTEASNPKMIPNTGSLLDEYQYDDEETIDLLNAIKNWNLKRPPNSPEQNDDAGSASLGSTIGTNATSDFDTITAGSTNTSKGGYSYTASSGVKTPLCNYSSKPSSLTARILQDHDLPVSTNTNTNTNIPSQSKIHGVKHKNYISASDNHEKEVTAKAHFTKLDKVANKPPPIVSTSTQTQTQQTADSNSNTAQLPQYVTTSQNENMQALEILRKTAAELGLSSDELHAVLPTVQKLVKVITQHVPRLETFVDKVCDIVIDENNDAQHARGGENFSTPQRKQRRRRNRKNMEARKERMDAAVHTLEKQWKSSPNRNGNGMVLKEVDANVMDMVGMDMGKCMENQTMGADDEVILDYHDYHSYGVFTTAIKERLSRRQRQFNFAEVKTPISSNKDQSPTSSQSLTDAEALDEINRLIEFEEKYSEKVNGMMDSESSASASANANGGDETVSPSLSSMGSPAHGDTVLRDLLSADTTTLRRFVLHFAYLFTVRQENILGKMNDLYVFSHEATSLINGIKKAMGLSPICPVHSVARQVVAVIESSQSTST